MLNILKLHLFKLGCFIFTNKKNKKLLFNFFTIRTNLIYGVLS